MFPLFNQRKMRRDVDLFDLNMSVRYNNSNNNFVIKDNSVIYSGYFYNYYILLLILLNLFVEIFFPWLLIYKILIVPAKAPTILENQKVHYV